MTTPMVIMDWTFEWYFYAGRWTSLFPESVYGATNFDTHIYQFRDSVRAEERVWDIDQWPAVKVIANEVPTMVGEYTLSLNVDLPADESQGWAEYIQTRLHENGCLGSAHWQWKVRE